MGLFDRIRNELKEERSPAKTGWENMDVRQEQSVENERQSEVQKKRQYDKLIQVLKPQTPDVSKVMGEPEPAGPNDEDIVLAKIAYGQTTSKDFEMVLNNIKGPLTDRYGEQSEKAIFGAFSRISDDKHQLKMLQFAIGQNPDDYNKAEPDAVSLAADTFKNPMQFEAKMEPFMTYLAEHNSPEKVKEYEEAFDDLSKNLFGKKYEYFKRMQELTAKSARIFGAPEKSPLVPEGIPVVETEKSSERLIKGGSYYQISRAQAKNGIRAEFGRTLEYDQDCEDSSFVDPDKGFFGVFDGAGGHVGGRRASSIGAATMADMMRQFGEPKTPADLSDWLDEASRRVSNDPSAGYATATLAKVINSQNGKKAVIYAQVGDSRLYIIHKNGQAELVTKDEGFENKITNALGYDQDTTCRQAGYRELVPGDKIMLCSDGITGDKGTDLMSEQEVGAIVSGVDTAYAAQALVHQARKSDDRTAIVAEV
ncbi:protein phosphatase 2C domain-containing protein [Candidatus Saccharibacteria bacterium]|nr:protein phosphatase 2C domain-containing protein [Candidatus Saccharibacteria bacterium]